VALFGYHSMGCVGFDALLRHGFTIPAVVTHRDDPHEEVWWESLADRAEARGIPVRYPEKAELKGTEIARLVESLHPDFIFSFYYRFMIPPAVLAFAPRGAFNLHGSLLPHYRGRAPVNWVLVNGEHETGVSLHEMVAKPDAGDLVDQERVTIAPEDTAFTLFRKLEVAAATLLDRALPLLREGRASRRPLDLAAGSYFGGRKPEDGRFAWSWPAARIYNLVRAVTHPYPGAFTALGGRKLFVWWAIPIKAAHEAEPGTVLVVDREGITVATGGGALRLVTLQLEAQPELPACSFALAEGIAPGLNLANLDAVSGHGPRAAGNASRVSRHRPRTARHGSYHGPGLGEKT
jgi:methionyl-tRNA formyltransferase